MIFFTSDTHFGHRGIIEHCHRPFDSPARMDEGLIERWNEVVGPNDEVYHLGDVSFRSMNRTAAILGQLHGRKHLVRGNHDIGLRGRAREQFATITPYHELVIDGQMIVLCHYPLQVWNKAHYGSWHLHGHSHGNLPPIGRRLDVGVDTNNLRPYSLEDVAAIMAEREFVAHDHHTEDR